METPKLDERTDLNEDRYPHGSLARQEEVVRREAEEAWDKLTKRPVKADEPSGEGNGSDVPESQWRGSGQ